jgi:hypothetical protein
MGFVMILILNSGHFLMKNKPAGVYNGNKMWIMETTRVLQEFKNTFP